MEGRGGCSCNTNYPLITCAFKTVNNVHDHQQFRRQDGIQRKALTWNEAVQVEMELQRSRSTRVSEDGQLDPSSGSWMQATWRRCSAHIARRRSLSKRRTPSVSQAAATSCWRRHVVASTPRVCRRQCLASSVRVSSTSNVQRAATFAARNAAMSSACHSNMRADNRAMNVAYRAWLSVVTAAAKRRMKCQMSSRTVTSGQRDNISLTFGLPMGEQQSRST